MFLLSEDQKSAAYQRAFLEMAMDLILTIVYNQIRTAHHESSYWLAISVR
jgi:hypothetical protein